MYNLNQKLFRQIFYLTLKIRREWFLPDLEELFKSQYYDHERLTTIQIDKMNRLIGHARRNIPFYKDRLPPIVKSLKDIENIPFLEKDDIRSNYEELLFRGKGRQSLKTSGGSTGAPITLLKDNQGLAHEFAAAWRGYSWAGIKIGHRQARFWGIPRNIKEKWRAHLIDLVCNRHRITAFDYDETAIRKSIKAIELFRPDFFYGYTSIIKEFAQFIKKLQLDHQLRPTAVVTTSEVLTPHARQLIEEVFETSVYNEYGCGEVGTIAHECEQHNLHINMEKVILEIIDENGIPAQDGQTGEVVVTDLTNYSMPLIRYRLKDYGELSNNLCNCGRSLPVLRKIYGRQYDALQNSSGRRFHGEFFLYILEDAKKHNISVSGVQFLQHPDLNLEIRIAGKHEQFDKVSKFIDKRLKQDFDNTLTFLFRHVDRINREASGKLSVVKRLLDIT